MMPAPTSDAAPAGIDVDAHALLTDAGIVRLRSVRQEDVPALRDMYGRVSPDTLYLRFFTASRTVADEEVSRLTRPEDAVHYSLIAQIGGEVVGAATYERLDDPTEAEVAFVVDDRHQGRGVGMLMLEHLATVAVSRGIVTFRAETLPANARMLHVFSDAGFPVTTRLGNGVVHVVMPLRFDEDFRRAVDLREAKADAFSLRRVIAPTSVVVVGAGADPIGLGHQVLANIVRGGYKGALHAVNRSGHRVVGVPAYKDLDSVPGQIDVVVVAVPASGVLDVARQAAARGAAGLVVITAGFAEVGRVGQQNQTELVRICRGAGMRLIGPNCMGIANAGTGVQLNATFSPTMPPAGGIGLMSQSGAVGIAALDFAARSGLGMSSFVSAGNKADVSGNDLLCFWEQDDATNVCALYLESFGNPRKFARIAARVGRSKPVVAVKSGRTVAGRRGAASHTAAAATPDVAVDSLFAQAGVTRVDSLDELFDVATLFDLAPLPKGRRVAIVGNSGGPGVLAADACESAGLDVTELSDTTRRRLAALLPPGAAISNPVDLLAATDPASFEAALRVLLDDGDVDAVITVYTPIQPGSETGISRAIATVQADAPGKPILACFLGLTSMPKELRDHDGRPLVPFYSFPEPAARSLAKAVRYASWRARPAGEVREFKDLDITAAREMVSKALAENPDGVWLDARVATELVATHGVRVATSTYVRDAGEATAAAVAIGFPVVLKAAAGDLVHKTELGGVRLNLRTPLEVAEAFTEMSRTIGEQLGGAIVQPMVGHGVETAIGVVADPTFGPLVMVGLGGVASDLLADRAFHMLPMTVEDAQRQIRSLRGAPLLFGYRNTPKCDVDALEDMVLRVAQLATNVPEISELDLNPVTVSPDGAIAVDVKVRLRPALGRDPLARQLR
jgi:acyl-CoA synthetase (NDP forming)/GNAT superfamily N-acetyltransferase